MIIGPGSEPGSQRFKRFDFMGSHLSVGMECGGEVKMFYVMCKVLLCFAMLTVIGSETERCSCLSRSDAITNA